MPPGCGRGLLLGAAAAGGRAQRGMPAPSTAGELPAGGDGLQAERSVWVCCLSGAQEAWCWRGFCCFLALCVWPSRRCGGPARADVKVLRTHVSQKSVLCWLSTSVLENRRCYSRCGLLQVHVAASMHGPARDLDQTHRWFDGTDAVMLLRQRNVTHTEPRSPPSGSTCTAQRCPIALSNSFCAASSFALLAPCKLSALCTSR